MRPAGSPTPATAHADIAPPHARHGALQPAAFRPDSQTLRLSSRSGCRPPSPSITFGEIRCNTTFSVYFLDPLPHTKESYGFEYEVLLAYSKYPTLEPRALQAVETILSDDP